MPKVAYLFPGQGSQQVGMGANLCAHSPAALRVFDEADEILGVKLSTYCFYGPEERLRETTITQPALFVTSVAALRALQEAGAPGPDAVAGHSIGEYAALVAAGTIDFETGLHLVARRAQEMHRASLAHPGTMAAILGLDRETALAVCRQAEEEGHGQVDAANFNSPGQVVISGEADAVARAGEIAREKGARKVVALSVSGAFHSRLMVSAAETMALTLGDAVVKTPSVPIVANVTADYETDPEEIKKNLAVQIDHPVLWEQSIQRLGQDGFEVFVEVGSGTVLGGLLKRNLTTFESFAVGDASGVAAWAGQGSKDAV